MTLIRKAYEQNKGSGLPMCPRSWGPDRAPEHDTTTHILDMIWNHFPRGRVVDGEPDDGLYVDESVEAVAELIRDRMSGYMLPHVELVVWYDRGANVRVRAHYFRCHTCGYVLPAAEAGHDALGGHAV